MEWWHETALLERLAQREQVDAFDAQAFDLVPDQLDIARRLANATPPYVARLIRFTRQTGWHLDADQDPPSWLASADRLRIEHPVFLRHDETGQAGILSQVSDDDHEPSGVAYHLGPAPYGSGTRALLYVIGQATQ